MAVGSGDVVRSGRVTRLRLCRMEQAVGCTATGVRMSEAVISLTSHCSYGIEHSSIKPFHSKVNWPTCMTRSGDSQ